MKKITQTELKEEFIKIVDSNPNDINIDNKDLDILISASKLDAFLFGSGKGNGDMSAYDALISALEPLGFIHEHKVYVIHFLLHPDYPMINISEAMDIIHEVAHEDAEIIFGTKSDKSLPIDYVEAKAFIAINE